MKIRSDFVSNSSSSSFIVATNSTYQLKDFAKDLGKSCSNPKSEFHDKDLAARNRLILEFCLSTYQAAFLGNWNLGIKEIVYTKESLKEQYKEILVDMPDYVDREWNQMLKDIEDCKKPNAPDWLKERRRDFVKGNEIHVIYDNEQYMLPVDNDTMSTCFKRYHIENDDTPKNNQFRCEQLRKYAESYENLRFTRLPDCFAITKDSIANTQQLIAAGEKIDLGKLKLDDLNARLDAGEHIYAIRIGYSGDGYGSYYIYDETDGMGTKNVAMEILESESL